jgi:hypothetical protein
LCEWIHTPRSVCGRLDPTDGLGFESLLYRWFHYCLGFYLLVITE